MVVKSAAGQGELVKNCVSAGAVGVPGAPCAPRGCASLRLHPLAVPCALFLPSHPTPAKSCVCVLCVSEGELMATLIKRTFPSSCQPQHLDPRAGKAPSREVQPHEWRHGARASQSH